MARVYAIKPEVVDRVLGSAIYANWQKVHDAFIDEQSRAYTNESRYAGAWAGSLRKQLQADLAFAEKCVDDYLVFLERTTASGSADVTDGEKILDILVLAISVLNSVNDLLDEMFSLGILALFGVLETASLQTEARSLQAILKRLQAELEKAKREVTEAYVQTGINVAVTGILLCTGPLGWLALGAVGLGQMVADNYLGPSTSDSATWGSRANTTLGTAASASQKYVEATSKIVKVAKPAGKFLPVVGFAFERQRDSRRPQQRRPPEGTDGGGQDGASTVDQQDQPAQGDLCQPHRQIQPAEHTSAKTDRRLDGRYPANARSRDATHRLPPARLSEPADCLIEWWAMQGLNLRPHPCEGCALPLS